MMKAQNTISATDRAHAPLFKLPKKLEINAEIKDVELPNGLKLTVINSGAANVARFSLVFNAGSRYQKHLLVASNAMSMLLEGSLKHTADEIAEMLDFYGSSVDVDVDRDWACISFYSTSKYFEKTLQIADEILKNPTFPEKELSVLKQNKKQDLIIENEKTASQASKAFIGALYGKRHIYGVCAEPQNYDVLTSDMLRDFYKNFYSSANAFAVVAGKVGEEEIKIISKFFGNEAWGSAGKISSNFMKPEPNAEKMIVCDKNDCNQTSLRMGKILFGKHNADFTDLSFVVSILGGYFGSRLMRNIREDKGYTYGIYSSLVSTKDSGYIVISSELANGVVKQTIDEIKKEISILQTNLISEEELLQVRNYTIGQLLRSMDGPWDTSDVYISLIENNLAYNYPQQVFNCVKNITPERIRQLAQKYLNADDMTSVIVGKM